MQVGQVRKCSIVITSCSQPCSSEVARMVSNSGQVPGDGSKGFARIPMYGADVAVMDERLVDDGDADDLLARLVEEVPWHQKVIKV